MKRRVAGAAPPVRLVPRDKLEERKRALRTRAVVKDLEDIALEAISRGATGYFVLLLEGNGDVSRWGIWKSTRDLVGALEFAKLETMEDVRA